MNAIGPRLLIAVTGHGFGHATRSAEVARALLRLVPGLRLTLSGNVPQRLFELEEHAGRVDFRRADYEPGAVQRDCFEVDWDATRSAYRRHLKARTAQLATERDWLVAGGYRGVIADVPALPIAAAAALGLPAAALWNFTWDWILDEELAPAGGGDGDELERLPGLLRADYARAGLHLKLPFSPGATPFSHVEPAPLVGRRSSRSREQTLPLVGLDSRDASPVVLVAMGGWGCAGWKPIAVQAPAGARFLVVGDLPIEAPGTVVRLPAEIGGGYRFCDLVAAADLVVSKPGYGICSECIVNRTPLLGVERRGFREAAELLREMPAYGPFGELTLEDFREGCWQSGIERLLASPTPWRPVEADAAERIALRLARHFGL